ncbi:MAG TPA: CDP-glycerol glycerophosphotransferase family protein, partial [Chlamydiales bacterium]|nr:CDP-glycerol glycerophosphotransferase family protein [Chlamydiales bacterium]
VFSCLPAVMLSKLFFSVKHLYGKHVLSIWCPHGSSDKGTAALHHQSLKDEQYALVYGQKMRDFFRDYNVFEELKGTVAIGNYRHRLFSHVKPFYMNLFQTEIGSQFAEQKDLILYAPTWSDGIEPTTFFDACPTLIDELPDTYNLIVKIHPNLNIQNLMEVERVLARYEHHPSVQFVSEFPLIYPILENVKIYMGDRSSIGYDFLTYNRPMLFIGPERANPLQRCGLSIPLDSLHEIYSILEDHLEEDQSVFEQARRELYEYTFESITDDHKLKKEIQKLYNNYFNQIQDSIL